MTGIPQCDFHIHTKYLKCANETMEIPAIIRECERLGIKSLGITDHLNTLDKLALHIPIKNDIESLDTDIDVYFGVELNFSGPYSDFAFSREIKEEYGFQFAIGGIHSTYTESFDLKKIIEIQHRHHLKTCQDPLVDVLVHPYWYGKHEFDNRGWPWIDSMQEVPERYVRELGQVAKETNTAIEINACANLVSSNHSDRYVKEYVEYLTLIAEEGACFSLGSDAHDIGDLEKIAAARQVAEELKLTADYIWRPSGMPLTGKLSH